MSGLEAVLAAGDFAITAEATPPLSADPADLLRVVDPLRGRADAVNLTDAARARVHPSSLAAAAILARAGIEPVLQMTCRDRNRIALQCDLLGAAALGVENVLVLRGDDPKEGDQPEAAGVFDLDTRGLLETARMLASGALPNGTRVAPPPRLFLGAADTPVDPPPGWRPHALAAKLAAGARFVQTQFCFDLGVVRRWAGALEGEGIAEKLHVLVGLGPLVSARSARWMRANLWGTLIPEPIVARLEGAADEAAEGKRIVVELMQGLAETKGIAGVHLMAPRHHHLLPELIEESGLGSRRARLQGGKRR
jgi:methylenetetrahydrofolate reductase (NADPH)